MSTSSLPPAAAVAKTSREEKLSAEQIQIYEQAARSNFQLEFLKEATGYYSWVQPNEKREFFELVWIAFEDRWPAPPAIPLGSNFVLTLEELQSAILKKHNENASKPSRSCDWRFRYNIENDQVFRTSDQERLITLGWKNLQCFRNPMGNINQDGEISDGDGECCCGNDSCEGNCMEEEVEEGSCDREELDDGLNSMVESEDDNDDDDIIPNPHYKPSI